MGYSDAGCFGGEIRTPHLDALAARGLRFTQFYNCAVCCPTRASLLTGLYPHQAGVGWMVLNGQDSRPPGPYQGYLNDRCVTLAEVLKSAGYRTFMSGKWHVGESRPHWPVDRGFDRYFGLISGAANYFDLSRDYLPGTVRQMALDGEPYHPPREGFYMTDAIADQATDFLRQAARTDEPFFLYAAFTAPHFPLHAKPEDIARQRGRFRAGWDELRQGRLARQRELGIVDPGAALSARDASVPAWTDEPDRAWQEARMEIYAAQVESMDAGIGRILAELERTGRAEDTLVLFLSDNGAEANADFTPFRPPEKNRPPFLGGPESFIDYGNGWANLSDTPYRKFKAMVEEGGIAAPLIVAGPGVTAAPGSLCHAPGHVVDLMPTFAELGGARYPRRFRGREILPMEGVSLVPLFRGETRPARGPLGWEFEGQRALRDGDWKLLGSDDGPWELYDLAHDRIESDNQAAAQPERVRALAARYEEWARRCGVRRWKEVHPALVNVPGVG
jgi:arylsulfatase